MPKTIRLIGFFCLSVVILVVSCKKGPTLETLLEQAETYQQQSKFSDAIATYQEIVKNYPKAAKSPQCQFMIGYLYGNHLNNKDLSKKAYEDFIQKYPEHELVKDAQWELDHLGMDVNKIDELNKILATTGDSSKVKRDTSKVTRTK